MSRRSAFVFLIVLGLVAFPHVSPAPLVYTPGEGWSYEPIGGGKWQRDRAEDQLAVAQEAFSAKDHSLALKAARRVIQQWPLSDFAPQAQYLVGQCYEARGQDEKAFNEYQKVVEKYPKIENFEEILERQFAIANRYLGGQWFKVWGYIPIFPSMERTAEMYRKIVQSGPFSEVAPQAQMNIGTAREKQSNFPEAVKAFERAADRYHDRKAVAADALYKAGMASYRQAKSAEYDQNTAAQAIATFTDFMTLYPNDARVPEVQQLISGLRTEQARGSYEIARFYEKRQKWNGALVYYNEVLVQDPKSPWAAEARERIAELQKQVETAAN